MMGHTPGKMMIILTFLKADFVNNMRYSTYAKTPEQLKSARSLASRKKALETSACII